MKMGKGVSIFLTALLLASTCPLLAEAKTESFTIKVSCTIPAQLELSSPASFEQEQPLNPIISETPSRIQTQEIIIQGNQKTIIHTIVAR